MKISKGLAKFFWAAFLFCTIFGSYGFFTAVLIGDALSPIRMVAPLLLILTNLGALVAARGFLIETALYQTLRHETLFAENLDQHRWAYDHYTTVMWAGFFFGLVAQSFLPDMPVLVLIISAASVVVEAIALIMITVMLLTMSILRYWRSNLNDQQVPICYFQDEEKGIFRCRAEDAPRYCIIRLRP